MKFTVKFTSILVKLIINAVNYYKMRILRNPFRFIYPCGKDRKSTSFLWAGQCRQPDPGSWGCSWTIYL